MLRYAFRLHRWGMIGFGLVLFLSTALQASAYTQIAGTSTASRAAFARSMGALAAQLTYLLPPPHRLDTVAGYVQWRAYGALSLIVMVWTIAAAAGAVRADEEKQLVDSWLAARVSRGRLVVSRLAAFAAAALVVSVLGGVGALLGAAGAGGIDVGAVAGQTLALWLFALTCFSLVSLVAQLVSTTRGAQAAGAGVLVVLYLFEVLGRTEDSLDWLAWVAPYRWYEASDILAPGGHLDAAGLALSVAVTAVATVLSALAFTRRDVRGPLFAGRARVAARHDANPSPALSRPVARLLYRQRWVLAGWGLGTVVMAAFMVSIAKSAVTDLLGLPGMREFMTHGAGGDPTRGFISLFWFAIAQLLLAGFAVHLVSGWAADDNEGVLVAVLSTPRRRWGVVVERAVAAVAGVVLLVAVGSLTASLTAAAAGVGLEADAVFRASWLLVPFALTFAAVGAAGGARWPRAVVGVLGVIAFLSFLVYELGPLLNWPAWASDLSVFALYGTPLLTGVFWNGLWAMLALIVAGFGLAALLMQRRELTT